MNRLGDSVVQGIVIYPRTLSLAYPWNQVFKRSIAAIGSEPVSRGDLELIVQAGKNDVIKGRPIPPQSQGCGESTKEGIVTGKQIGRAHV